MAKPFKFRYVNEIVGGFVLLIVVLLLAGIVLAGRAQEWFVPRRTFTLQFKDQMKGTLGLQKGASVQILGATVGRLQKISVDDSGAVSGEIQVKGDFLRFVCRGSVATVKKAYIVAGDAFIVINKGLGPPLPEGAVLECVEDVDVVKVAQDVLAELKAALQPLLVRVDKAIAEYTGLAADLRDPAGHLQKMMADIEQITAGLRQGEGTAGQLLRKDGMADQIKEILGQVNAALADLKRILADVQKTTTQLPPMAQAVGGEMKDLPGMVLQTQETIRESERLIEGLQRHWLLRGSMPAPQPTGLIPPAEVGK